MLNYLPIVRALLQAGADPNIVVVLFPLNAAQSAECVRELLKAGADLNLRDDEGRTALYYNAAAGSLEIIKCLIEAGADVNLANNYGEVPLMRLKLGPRVEVAKLLVEAGADVNYVFERKSTILDYVRSGYHDDESRADAQQRAQIVEYLRSRGAKTFRELQSSR